MNVKEELSIELEDINNQIEILNKRKRIVEDKLSSISPFKERFLIWFNNGDVCHYDWLVREEEYPLIRGEFDKNPDAYRRSETITLERLLCEEIFDIWAHKQIAHYCDTDEEYDEFYEELDTFLTEYQPLLEEAMNKNLKSFRVDW